MTYQEVCASIERRGYFSKQAASEHAEKCLERMGHPDKKPGLVIHVAGTNGKGSVCSFLASVLREVINSIFSSAGRELTYSFFSSIDMLINSLSEIFCVEFPEVLLLF